MHALNELLLRLMVGYPRLPVFVKDEKGQTLAEYGLIVAVIAVAIVVAAAVAFRTAIVGAFNEATNCLTHVTAGC